ncbi:hypothetical protein WJU16_08295 [Chitinophaga pollutisoli]|uniref:Uncharacterized protein n=1 Tax=Chitinophaga pollutisoli TaxID=3133966 RepID=A0ABZ2YUF4_9BACT
MVVGNYYKCVNCDHQYRIRYNIGGNFPQSSSFYCKTCGISITYGYDGNRKLVLDNIEEVEESNTAQVINLHPELSIDESKESDPTYFPSIEFMIKQKGLEELKAFRHAQVSNVEFISKWDECKEDFRLLTEERWPLLEKKFGTDRTKIKRILLDKVISAAEVFLEGKWKSLIDGFRKELALAKAHPNYPQLKTFLEGYRDEFMFHKLYEIMNQYRSVESELLSTLLEQKRGNKPSGLSSSAKWEKIERIYGDFYEVYGDLAVIPTVINNLLSRNNYDQFATPGFTLKAYLETDKAKRCINFAGNANLAILGQFYDASLRNGTHHKTAKINKAKQKIVLKTGKGGKSEKVWSFVEYIEFCNEIFARCLTLLIIYDEVVV